MGMTLYVLSEYWAIVAHKMHIVISSVETRF